MSPYVFSSQLRHPELVSGSIWKLALPNRRQTQSHRKINPMRIFSIDKVDLPRAMPVFQLFFARNGGLHGSEDLKMDKAIYRVFGSVAWRQFAPMLRKAFQKVRGSSNIQRAVVLTGKNIHARLFFLSHPRSIAAKWTLKQVQGDGVRELAA